MEPLWLLWQWDKHSEQWVKESGLKDGEGKEDQPLCMTFGHREDSHAYHPELGRLPHIVTRSTETICE